MNYTDGGGGMKPVGEAVGVFLLEQRPLVASTITSNSRSP